MIKPASIAKLWAAQIFVLKTVHYIILFVMIGGTVGAAPLHSVLVSLRNPQSQVVHAKLTVDSVDLQVDVIGRDSPGALTVALFRHPSASLCYAFERSSETGYLAFLSAYEFAEDNGQAGFVSLGKQEIQTWGVPLLDASARCWVLVDRASLPVVVPVTGEADDTEPSAPVIAEAQGTTVKAPQPPPTLLTPTITPDNRFVVLPLPHQRQIRVFPLVSSIPKVERVPSFTLELPEPAAPETLVFHPMRRWAYGIGEHSITTFGYKDGSGELSLTSAQDLPTQGSGRSSVRKLLVHPEGTFLYALTGDAIAIFSCSAREGGRLVLRGQATLEAGLKPTDIAIDTDGNWLIAAFKENHLVRLFRIQKNQGGGLVTTGKDLKVESPHCLLLMKTEQCCGG